MTAVAPRPVATRPYPVRRQVKGSALTRILRTTDAKQIGIMYLVTSVAYYVIGGFLALLMRSELARPGMQFLSPEQFNQLFTMHGTIMLLSSRRRSCSPSPTSWCRSRSALRTCHFRA